MRQNQKNKVSSFQKTNNSLRFRTGARLIPPYLSSATERLLTALLQPLEMAPATSV